MSLLEIRIEFLDQPRAHLKSMNSSRAGKDTLGEGVGLRVRREDLGLQTSLEDTDNDHNSDSCRRDAEADECELPLNYKGDNEGCDEDGETLEGETELLGDAALDELPVRGGLRSDGSSGAKVVIGDLLGERGTDVGAANIADDAVAYVGEEDIVKIGQDEAANAEVDKVQSVNQVSSFFISGEAQNEG